MLSIVAVSLLLVGATFAAPTSENGLIKRQSITTLSATQIATFKPYTFFASAAYCNPSAILTWSCGAKCSANAGFIPVASGGDGSSTQFWYVGYSPAQKSVIVSHQGTDTSKIQALATDADAFQGTLDSTLFPGISSSVKVHSGFGNEQAKTATQILSAVRTAISAHAATKVTVVGHSLGAAIALLDGVYLPLHISGVTFQTIGYGMPRVGNQDFANYVDSHITLTHINNREDFVPILPGRFLGYHHPAGEVHIDSGTWSSCPGQDNTSSQCTVGDVGNIFEGSTGDHSGPYDGIQMGC
ncbi:lipase class 3 family protein [Crucibulum laeve]|uniref:Lipase class 3 family protein n=1 Tax=Crucibulum laeve TaxID=68775 RepID=A0A5C3M4L8_9AGAR|nr:lipase class 3 family protein [Crucibulum laeve]